MSITLGRAFTPDWQGRPPGMSRRDRVLWTRFQAKYSGLWLRVYYNCRVGLTEAEQPAKGSGEFPAWTVYTLPRIDAVVETSNTYVSIEVRPGANRGALGAALTYKYLFEKTPINRKVIIAAVVTDKLTDIYLEIYRHFKVLAFEV